MEAELDTQGEEFCSASEMQMYFNSAVTMCEAEILKLGLREKYLQGEAFISAVAGQTDYDLPSDIAINKIRKVVYRNGTLVYTVHPLRTERAYETEDVMALYPPNEYYHYQIYKIGTVHKFRISPKAYVSVANAFRMAYMKTLNRYTVDSVLCDLPDICYEFIMSYVRYRVYAKESHVNTPDEKQNVQICKDVMVQTLQNQVADPDMDKIDADTSHYEEMV